ncbi:hypothetical protein [Nocardiopsis baichengensis]|uniref:hypothetical protein n=1 Tax=Nocardiopsis baichengensis TaxID=280240 RepID=UPI00034A8641|nr:hypothetical protein [Nocardiopsis baichengensis]
MTERDPEWESERFGGDDERLRGERREEERLEAEMGDDDQEVDVGLWERYIEDPPEGEVEPFDTDEEDRPGGLGISQEVAEETRRGERDAPLNEYEEGGPDGPEDGAMDVRREE